LKHWSDDYIGLVYSEFNCAELAREIQATEFDRWLDMPVDTYQRNRACDLLDDYGIRTNSPEDGDACVMTHAEKTKWHLGIVCVIAGQTWILHSLARAGSVRSRPYALERYGLEIEGYYKWKT